MVRKRKPAISNHIELSNKELSIISEKESGSEISNRDLNKPSSGDVSLAS